MPWPCANTTKADDPIAEVTFMKTTNRAARKGGKKSSSPQQGSALENAPGKALSACEYLTVGLFPDKSGRAVEKFKMHKTVFEFVRLCAPDQCDESDSMNLFVIESFREIVARVHNQDRVALWPVRAAIRWAQSTQNLVKRIKAGGFSGNLQVAESLLDAAIEQLKRHEEGLPIEQQYGGPEMRGKTLESLAPKR